MGQFIDLTGQRFGQWTVIKRAATTDAKHIYWECICECGVQKNVLGSSLKRGKSTGCGCRSRDKATETSLKNGGGHYPTFNDLKGKRFGRWTVIERIGKLPVRWLCECDCGRKRVVHAHSLISGKSESCGCKAVETMMSRRKYLNNNASHSSLSPNPTIQEMITEVLGKGHGTGEKDVERAFRKCFQDWWQRAIRNECSVIRRHKHPFCEICGDNTKTELHHIIPVSAWGGNEPENLLWVCHKCHQNIEKGKMTVECSYHQNPTE